jgi:hypothetical protein
MSQFVAGGRVSMPMVSSAAACSADAGDLVDELLDFAYTPQGMLVVAGAASLLTRYRARVVSYGLVLFLAMYVYERASYTRAAKIHRLKNQLIDHATANLRQLSPHTAFYCAEDLSKVRPQLISSLP